MAEEESGAVLSWVTPEEKERAKMQQQMDNVYGYDPEQQEKPDESMIQKVMKYLIEMRKRQMARSEQQMKTSVL
jgi:hypothetical protein